MLKEIYAIPNVEKRYKDNVVELTNELMNYLYDSAFSKFDYGYSAAQAVFMGVMIFALTFIQRVLQKEDVN